MSCGRITDRMRLKPLPRCTCNCNDVSAFYDLSLLFWYPYVLADDGVSFFFIRSSTADTTAVPLKIRKVAGRSLCREQTKISIHLRGWYQQEDVRANNVSSRRKEYSEKVCAKERRYNIFRRFNSVARGSWDLGNKIHFIRETLLIYTSKRNAL